MSNRCFQVFKGASDIVVHRAKPKLAAEWVARGLAEVIGERQIRMVNPDRIVARTSDAMLSSGQDASYELAAIEPHRKFVQGGGVNGIRRSLEIEPFSGARVGHQ